MARRNRRSSGSLFAAFGVGLFLGCCFPAKYLVVILAVAVILCGIALWK